MTDFNQKYQRWLAELSQTLQQAQQQQQHNLEQLGQKLTDYIQAGRDLTAYETRLFMETFKRQWQDGEEQPSYWPEYLWQQLSEITDRTKVEWQELNEDFKHKGVYYQGEWVGMGRYRCDHCLGHTDYTHPAELLPCAQCGGVTFCREGLPV